MCKVHHNHTNPTKAAMLASAFDLHLLWELCPPVCVRVRVLSEHLDRRERHSQVKHMPCTFVCVLSPSGLVCGYHQHSVGQRKRAVKYLEMDEKSWASVDIGIVGI